MSALEDMRKAREIIKNKPLVLCGTEAMPHTVHPDSLGQGFTVCANCFEVVFV